MPETTPLQYYENFIKPFTDIGTMIYLINDPRHEYFTVLRSKSPANVNGGRPAQWVNVPIDVIIAATMQAITLFESSVWFGCDTDQFSDFTSGTYDLDLFEFKSAFGVENKGLNKADRLRYGDSSVSHAMLFTGVHVEAEIPGNTSSAFRDSRSSSMEN